MRNCGLRKYTARCVPCGARQFGWLLIVAQHLNRLLVAHPGGHRLVAGLILCGIEDSRLPHDSAAHFHLEMNGPPLIDAHIWANVRLLYPDPAALVEPSQNPPSKVHIALQAAFQPDNAKIYRINPDRSRHLSQNLRFKVWRREAWIRFEGEH